MLLRLFELVSLFRLTSTRRVMIFKALHQTDWPLFPTVLLLRCYCLYIVFFLSLLYNPLCMTAELTFYPILTCSSPLLQAASFYLEIQPNLEALIPVGSVSYVSKVSPFKTRKQLSWPFVLWGIVLVLPDPLIGLGSLLEFYKQQKLVSSSCEALPLWSFYLLVDTFS